jgi:hypothetical protein
MAFSAKTCGGELPGTQEPSCRNTILTKSFIFNMFGYTAVFQRYLGTEVAVRKKTGERWMQSVS